MRVIQEDVCGSLIHRTIIETSPEETKMNIKNQEAELDPKKLADEINKRMKQDVSQLFDTFRTQKGD
ncbi:hypothetical protein [Lentilactobacillus kisonensis]|uniref:Uncharacterized protein n=1 Tax=Lentilactobacillus kisonensis DSM 19906 = JCM 15041 TaxID=1423766 RepID=A0A0R1NNT4_9LACO|nr:hypothetical protein [Lentilactobacillus kisonensis]KRL21889.1 hypothetical protein FC98_GL000445 [Lentilactobacillus kisonensis DSM 19906 = JCM 15041]